MVLIGDLGFGQFFFKRLMIHFFGKPVAAAAVIFPANLGARWLTLVRDSKQLTAKRRESLSPLIAKAAIGIGIGLLPPDAIDDYGIVKATRLAMCAAVDHLPCF